MQLGAGRGKRQPHRAASPLLPHRQWWLQHPLTLLGEMSNDWPGSMYGHHQRCPLPGQTGGPEFGEWEAGQGQRYSSRKQGDTNPRGAELIG